MDFFQAETLIRELTDITVNPDKHDQTVWIGADKNPEQVPESECGTVGCLAGNTVKNKPGYKLIWEQHKSYDYDTGEYIPRWRVFYCFDSNGDQVSIERAFQELVGLNREQARDITAEDNSLADLWMLAIGYSGGLITVENVVEAFQSREAKLRSQLKSVLLKTVEEV